MSIRLQEHGYVTVLNVIGTTTNVTLLFFIFIFATFLAPGSGSGSRDPIESGSNPDPDPDPDPKHCIYTSVGHHQVPITVHIHISRTPVF